MENKYIDRNYILDEEGNYLKIIGNQHDSESIVSYVKFYPSSYYNRYINGKPYGYNTFANRSFAILLPDQNRFKYSIYHGGVVTCTPRNKIDKIYDCREKLSQIWQERERYESTYVGSELIAFLSQIKNDIDFNYLGITASFLIDAFNEKSDIDLVCYGKKGFEMMSKVFKDYVTPYDGTNGISLYNRRMIYMSYTKYETLMKQEGRKLQGLTKNKNIHINCQCLWENAIDPLLNVEIYPIGEISCIAKICGDKDSIFSPALYDIEIASIIDGELNGVFNGFEKKITHLISYLGAYSCTFKEGEFVYIEGMLTSMKFEDGSIDYGIELSPWNTNKKYKAVLLN
ncbi:MAG TPA: hypothetical protein PKY72_05525 [Bacilli bacterium]|nr:hypothetical protein [Bacilli bacterium]